MKQKKLIKKISDEFDFRRTKNPSNIINSLDINQKNGDQAIEYIQEIIVDNIIDAIQEGLEKHFLNDSRIIKQAKKIKKSATNTRNIFTQKEYILIDFQKDVLSNISRHIFNDTFRGYYYHKGSHKIIFIDTENIKIFDSFEQSFNEINKLSSKNSGLMLDIKNAVNKIHSTEKYYFIIFLVSFWALAFTDKENGIIFLIISSIIVFIFLLIQITKITDILEK